jgi:hypothetical protein
MTTDQLEIFDLLGVEPGTLSVSGVQVNTWGREVLIDCVYDDGGPRPFQLLFEACSSLQWDVHGEPSDDDHAAELMGLFLGEEENRVASIVYTDLFELSVLYGSFTLLKDW